MARKGKRLWILWASSLALFCRLCLAFPALLWERLSHPMTMALHRLTARVPFPVSEPVTGAVGVALLGAFIAALRRALSSRRAAPLLAWLRGVALAALALLWALALTWLPATVQPVDAPPVPDAGQLEWLCGQLIDRLNAASLAFPEPSEALELAPEAANLPGCAVKAARYPEWMRRAGISGLFAPPTGETLVDAGAPGPLLPFTAVHELMHLSGIADEGAANIAAWERCLDAGGPFADSARLWALRYALGQLRQADAEAWQRARGRMKDPLARVFDRCGGEIQGRGRGLPGLAGFAPARGDYAALAHWLAANSQ